MEINEVLNSFRDYLLNSDLKNNIVKIILFGSYAKRVASPDSDIDVLIFTTDGVDAEISVTDRVYDFMLEHNVPLEVVTSTVDELFLFQDYFTFNVTQYGLEVYSMEKEKIKSVMLRDIKGLAEEYFESGQEVLARNRVRLAVDAAYNAAELAAKGLILLKQDDLPGSHGGVVNLFGQLYVKTNEIDKEIGRGLNVALRLRNEARYKPNSLLNKDDAQNVLRLAEDLIKIVSEKIIGQKE